MRFETGTLDLDRRQWVDSTGRAVELSPLECDLLRYLGERAGVTVPRAELLEQVWGYAPGVRSRAVDHTVRRLRKKLDLDPDRPSLVQSVYGGGYRVDAVLDGAAGDPERQPLTELVGRDDDLVALEEDLAASRLVSLVGPGGVGKSALSRALLRRREGVWVSLADARTAGQLLVAVGFALNVPLGAEPEVSEARLGASLAARGPILLVLDNFEQLEDAASAVVARWLEAAPELQILATSRRPLKQRGERVRPLDPLDEDAALELLVARARAVLPEFSPVASEEVWRAVLEVLDRLPLAIELCAPRVGMLRPDALLARLQGSLGLVRTPVAGERPERHRALERSIEWSWSLLSGAEREALVGLARIPGPFGLEQAEAVIGGDEALDRVDALVGASLVAREADGRMVLYAAVRTFASARLDPALRLESEDRRRRWLLAAFPGADTDWRAAQATAMELAIWRGLDHAPEECAVLADHLYHVGAAVSAHRLMPLLDAVLERVEPDSEPGLLLRIDRLETQRIRGLGTAPLVPEIEAVIAAAETGGLLLPLQRATRIRGCLARGRGAQAVAEACLERSEALARELGDPIREAGVVDDLGLLYSRLGDGERARTHHQRALTLIGEEGPPQARSRFMGNLGKALRQAGRHEEAAQALERAIELSPAGFLMTRAVLLNNLANVQLEVGRYDEARATLREAVGVFHSVGATRKAGFALGSLALVACSAGDVVEGERRALEAVRALRGGRDALALGWSLMVAGLAALAQRAVEAARARFVESRPLLEQAGQEPMVRSLERSEGLLAALEGQRERAVESMGADDPLAPLARFLLGDRPTLSEEDRRAVGEDELGRMLLPLTQSPAGTGAVGEGIAPSGSLVTDSDSEPGGDPIR